MKADHRHELKTNELAEWLAHFPEWAKENRTTLIAAGAIVAVAIAVYFVRFYRKDVVAVREHVQLTGLVTQVSSQKRAIAQAASQGTDQSIALVPIAQDLQDFAAASRNDRLAALALIKRAEALRTELHYRLTDPPQDELARQIAQAQTSYRQALERASSSPALAAMAQFGLGLCEEELGSFDEAGKAYRAVAENPEYEGTAAQAAAAHRLKTMDDYKGTVVFKPAPEPKDLLASSPTVQITPDALNPPITIEAPNGVTITPVTPESNDVSEAATEPNEA
ncbi:MAG: tetratricopeptide repeat protein, partial [Planctomycetota bacterium]